MLFCIISFESLTALVTTRLHSLRLRRFFVQKYICHGECVPGGGKLMITYYFTDTHSWHVSWLLICQELLVFTLHSSHVNSLSDFAIGSHYVEVLKIDLERTLNLRGKLDTSTRTGLWDPSKTALSWETPRSDLVFCPISLGHNNVHVCFEENQVLETLDNSFMNCLKLSLWVPMKALEDEKDILVEVWKLEVSRTLQHWDVSSGSRLSDTHRRVVNCVV